jgi:hypothetical protein
MPAVETFGLVGVKGDEAGLVLGVVSTGSAAEGAGSEVDDEAFAVGAVNDLQFRPND